MKRTVLLILCLIATAAHAGLALLPGSSPQTLRTGTIPVPIRVQLTDANGMPIPGAPIAVSGDTSAFLLPMVPCSPTSCGPVTDASGIATLPPMVANRVGHWQLSISTPGYPPVIADIAILQAEPLATVDVVSGNNQVLATGTAGAPFAVRVTRNGQPVVGDTVRFSTISGGGPILFAGGLISSTATTDGSGLATSSAWTSTGGIGSGHVQVQTVGDAAGQEAFAQLDYRVVNSKGESYYPYKPLWWGGAAQSGWGIAIPQHTEHIFPVYFAYDSAGRPTWKAMQGMWIGGVGDSFRGDLYEYAGAPYFAFDTTKVHVIGSTPTLVSFHNQVTSASLALNANNGNIDPPPPVTVLPIQPFSFAPATPRAELGVSDIWWGGQAQSGWGIHIAEDQGNLFLTWFTYDADGRAVWFAMPEGHWIDDHTWTGPVVKTSGSSQTNGLYSVSMYSATTVGDFTIRFSGTTAATFTYNVEGHSGTLNLQRFDY